MNFKILTTVMCMLLASCDDRAVEQTSTTSQPDRTVDKLFEHEGCTVYRFMDKGDYHYYTVCKWKDDTTTYSTRTTTCGKNCTRITEHSIPTKY